MNKNSITFGIIGLIVGLTIGFMGANSLNRNASVSQEIPPNPATAPQSVQPPSQPPNGQNPQGGMLEDVQKTLDKAKNQPENFEAQIEAGRMYAQIQRFDEALEFFQKGQQLKPDDFAANALLGNAFFDAKQFENAETYYAKALEIKPNEVTIQSDYATTFFRRKNPDYERAMKEFEKALEINPKHEVTIYNMGLAYFFKGDKDNAAKTLERLKQVNPSSDLIKRLEQEISK